MYKLIASDIDATLIRSDFTLSQKNIITINAAVAKGVKFILTTGRMHASAKLYAKKLNFDTDILSCNGALAKNIESDEIIFSSQMDKEVCKEIFCKFREEKIYFQFYSEKVFYAEKIIGVAKHFREWSLSLPIEDRIPVLEALDIDDILNKDPIYKIYITSDGEEERKRHLEILMKLPGIEITSSWTNNYEICAKGVSKGAALERYGKIYDIKKNEIMAIGDNENDVEMISFAGMGVAVKNAEENVKKAANYITDSNDNDGVAKAIEKFIL